MSEMEMREGDASDQNEIFAMCELLRSAAAPVLAGSIDTIDPNQIAKMHAAAAVFAGILFGELIVFGLAREQDKRRAADGVAKNFRSGIDIGKKHALRVAEMMAGGAGHA